MPSSCDTVVGVHPETTLIQRSEAWGLDVTSKEFAAKLDEVDELKKYRQEYHYPKNGNMKEADLVPADEDAIYLCGNSCGLMAKRTKKYVDRELEKWAQIGVGGHFEGDMPWAFCDEVIQENMATIVGAKKDEVCVMNSLTVNQHLLLISFYQPTPTRHKVLIEDHAFPSDHYAVESQIRQRGYDPASSMIMQQPRQGQNIILTEDILDTIEREGDSIAVVLLSGVQYYTGQLFEMEKITRAAQKKGCYVGFDLAHAAGNVPLQLHDWNVDFACWCTYKYLSGGAGGIGGMFLHERHAHNDLPKLHGWWSHEFRTRFIMDNKLVASPSPACYRISNPSMLQCAALQGSLEVVAEAGMPALRVKSLLLTGYLELLITKYFHKSGRKDNGPTVQILTPTCPEQRGCQLSLSFDQDIDGVHKELSRRGVVCDLRRPSVIRVAPKPIYNTFSEVHRFVEYLQLLLPNN